MGFNFTQWYIWIPLTVLFLYLLSIFTKQNQNLPPGPTPLPIFGNLFDLIRELPHRSLTSLAKIHGPIISLKIGVSTLIVVSSPETTREILQTNDKFLSSRWFPDGARALGHNEISVVFLPNTDPLWKHIRTICGTCLFSARSLKSSQAMREQKAHELVAYVEQHAGESMRIGLVVFNSLLNFISSVLFSEDVVDLSSDSAQEFYELIAASIAETAKPNISDFLPFLRVLDLQSRRRVATENLRRFYKFFDDVIDRRINISNTRNEKNKDLLDSLLELHADNKIERRVIRALITDIFIAGAHTSSVTIEWTMAELLRNPDTMLKVRTELQQTIGSRHISESDINNLPYLQAVLKESMRLHPAAPLLLPHKASETVNLTSHTIPKGAQLMVNIWAIARDPNVWPDPEVFKPERFLEKNFDFRGQDFSFVPFGSGRRACPGMPLATRMIPLILASLLNSAEWKLPDGMEPSDIDMTEEFGAAAGLVVPLVAIPVSLSTPVL
ncbi:hypothetical protein LUZ60_000729 [Juncus effusus]|nr:hypothetical protein LUZ60_000729 [Juncus effusus]